MMPSHSSHQPRKTLQNNLFLYFVLLIVAVISRYPALGNPFIFFDEEFYLFVGGRMLHGDIPYVDVWDRKPIGLFLIYEFFHLFGPYRIWAYQIGALLSAWATSILCMKMARFIAPKTGAFLTGCLYLLWINGAQGIGGQAPVFYNLLITGAMLAIVTFLDQKQTKSLNRTGILVMALFGIAIQIKPTVVFEGIYAGLVLLWMTYQKTKSWSAILVNAFLWCGIALIPTLCVIGFYAGIGHFHDWWFANVSSIFLKQKTPHDSWKTFWHWIHWAVTITLLLLSIMILRALVIKQKPTKVSLIFITGWAWAAFAGFILFGCFSKHYALPLFAPFFINAAPLWQARMGRLWLIILVLWGGQRNLSEIKQARHMGSARDLKQITRLLSSPGGCVFNFGGPDIILDAVPYCPLTRLPFSAHLNSDTEKTALPVDPDTEMRRILALSPRYIIIGEDRSSNAGLNMSTNAILNERIKSAYKEIYRHKQDDENDNIVIFIKQ
ncbi:hypothetical protein CPA57_07655 [Bombella sp. TMW2.1880]|uniref:Glycosyltransferase RgtA/B/C/D-like domain-containing protein n=2 Tax=Bombella favorum TaxID=2039164 RepID=A0ABR5ZPM4_9PROT|nr:hypothetical protein [Bombella favorum]